MCRGGAGGELRNKSSGIEFRQELTRQKEGRMALKFEHGRLGSSHVYGCFYLAPVHSLAPFLAPYLRRSKV